MEAQLNLIPADIAPIAEGVQNMIDAAVNAEAPVKKAQKPKAPAKPKAEAKAPAKAKNQEKAKPILFKAASGAEYELAKDADPKALKAAASEVGKSLEAIGKKDADLLKHYLALGKFQSQAAPLFKSTKLYGQFLASELPASQELDAALRSNCKWLYEALNVVGAEGADILAILNVNRIEDYKSKNPTVIKRDYKAKAEEVAKAKLAEESGVSIEEMEAEAEAKAKAEEEAAKAKALALIKEFAQGVISKSKEGKDAEAEADLLDVIGEALFGKKKEALEMLNSLAPVKH